MEALEQAINDAENTRYRNCIKAGHTFPDIATGGEHVALHLRDMGWELRRVSAADDTRALRATIATLVGLLDIRAPGWICPYNDPTCTCLEDGRRQFEAALARPPVAQEE